MRGFLETSFSVHAYKKYTYNMRLSYEKEHSLRFYMDCIYYFFISLIVIVFNWSTIPSEVPTHYKAMGDPDQWGNKWFIFFPPLFGLMIWGFIRAMGSINLVSIPGFNEKDLNEAQKKNNKLLIQIVSNIFLIVMSLQSIKEMLTILGNPINLGYGEIIIALTLLVGPVLFFSYRSVKLGNQN